jgi:hemerythrin-like metal-binding protein
MHIEWNDISSVNVKEINEQHKKLVSIINRLFEIKESGKIEELNEIIKELMDYARYHFGTEEKYFDQFDYPEKDAHKKQHRLYIDKIGELEEQCQGDKKQALDALTKFLGDWWLMHINDSDIKYSDFFNQRGLF